jgi:hypothetical protein
MDPFDDIQCEDFYGDEPEPIEDDELVTDGWLNADGTTVLTGVCSAFPKHRVRIITHRWKPPPRQLIPLSLQQRARSQAWRPRKLPRTECSIQTQPHTPCDI